MRFICGTQDLHKQLEKTIADFFGTEDTILYAACFDANGGLFEPLLGEDDAIISDALNHASIIDGVRLCKAKRFRYANCDMADLEKQLQAADAAGCRTKLISTDGVFSMDGFIAPLDEITALAKKYGALVHIDECHATGFLGETGRGSAEVKGVLDRIDIITGTLGKAMGGALGGFTTAKKEVDRTAAPAFAPLSVLQLAAAARGRCRHQGLRHARCRRRPARNAWPATPRYFRERMTAAGFDIRPGVHPISPVMLYDAPLAQKFAAATAGRRHLRDRLLLPGGAQGPGADPHADQRRAYARTPRSCDRCVHAHRPRTGRVGTPCLSEAVMRRATTADLPAIVGLLADDPLGAMRDRAELPLDDRYLEAFAAIDSDPRQLLMVATLAGNIAGCMQLSFIPGLSRLGSQRALIEGVRVAATLRGHGIGEDMILWAKEEAMRRHCRILQLTTDRSRRDAHRFYERLGFVASHVGMKLDLGVDHG